MAVVDIDIQLDVARENKLRGIVAKQLDSNSRYLNCALMNGKTPVLIESGTVAVNAKRMDGTSRTFAGTINENGTVRVPITNWMLAEHGLLYMSVTVYGANESKLTSTRFLLEVQEAENQDETISPDDPNVDLALQIVSDAQDAADAAAASALEAAALAELATITNAQIDALFE